MLSQWSTCYNEFLVHPGHLVQVIGTEEFGARLSPHLSGGVSSLTALFFPSVEVYEYAQATLLPYKKNPQHRVKTQRASFQQ